MEIEFKTKTFIFIEESALIEESFHKKIKQFIEESKNSNIQILLDEEIELRKEYYITNKQESIAYLLDGNIDLLKFYNIVKFVKTNSYLDFTDIEKNIKTPKTASKYVITQKESVFKAIKGLADKVDGVKFFKFTGVEFDEWQLNQQNQQAFYLANDTYVINKIDTSTVDYVYSPKYGYLRLDTSSIITGGEGSVYRTYNNMMVKVFSKKNITYTNYKKLSKMVEMNVYNPYICWPKDLVYINNHFVGFVMDTVMDAKTLWSLRIQNFNNMTHIDRFKLCYNFLTQVKYLHEKGILIGDLKPDNILVNEKNEVFLIDCGCYQIGDYPCPVCNPNYTKREFKDEELKKQLRTIEDEYYPINKIAFEIILKKDHTFSPDNLDVENVDKNKFDYYDLNLGKMKGTSEDVNIWKGISSSMREFFYYYFKQGKITYLTEWTNELKLFIDKLEKGN